MDEKHRLAIDRSKRAKTVYPRGTPGPRSNRSDVEDYDTPDAIPPGKTTTTTTVKPKTPTTTISKTPREKPTGEYQPTESERKILIARFQQQPAIIQFKDLLTTRNVVRRKESVEKWKKNPANSDIRGIDTTPEDVYRERIRTAQEFTGANIYGSEYGKKAPAGTRRLSSRNRGYYLPGANYIKIREGMGDFQTKVTVSHELGHAVDHKYKARNNTRIGFGVPGLTPFEQKKKSKEQVEKITRTRFNPYNPMSTGSTFTKYRNRNEELFANWFSGFVMEKNVAKKKSRGFYNQFRSQNSGVFNALRDSDKRVLSGFVKGKF